MGFFDLNIPYHESDNHLPNKAATKTNRLKLAVKAMELGYCGAAYNRTIKGVMSETHRCDTPLFPLSSVLKLSPSFSYAAELHRSCLGLQASSPFRQYTRLTVVVESSAQASALNSGNPVLKSYDIVAVRPMNQLGFDQACTGSEVDMISIDFSEKLPFRLKHPMVKAAIERGVYFEIAYSALLIDVQLRRQMITSCKLLVDWTRGKNLIISSAAPSVTEIRGPYDVANLSLLLGLSMEHAKAAISKNCRSLIAKALRKKHYYKEAIRVEIILPEDEFDSDKHWTEDWKKWDPISSGEGDLFLKDMAKSFSAVNKVAKTVKSIDFASLMDKLPPHGLQVQELKPVREATIHSFETDSLSADTESKKLTKSVLEPSDDQTSLHINPSQHQIDSCEDSFKLNPSTYTQGCLSNDEKTVTHTAEEVEHNYSNGLGVHVSPPETEALCVQSQNCIRNCDTQVDLLDCRETIDCSLMDIDTNGTREPVSNAENSIQPINDVFPLSNMRISSHFGADVGSRDNDMKSVSIDMNFKVEDDLSLTSHEIHDRDNEQLKEITVVPDVITNASPTEISYDQKQKNDHIVMKELSIVTDTVVKGDLLQTLWDSNGGKSPLQETKDASVALPVLVSQDEINCSSGHVNVISELSNDVAMEEQKETGDHAQSSSPVPVLYSSSGKKRMKSRMPSQAFVFPFKRLLNQTPFKRKSRKAKTQSKLL